MSEIEGVGAQGAWEPGTERRIPGAGLWQGSRAARW